MTDDGYANRHADGLVSSPTLICKIGSEEGHEVDPESVESVDGLRSLWSSTEGTRYTL